MHAKRTEVNSLLLHHSSPHFSSGKVERAKRKRAWKSPHARKARRNGERGKISEQFLQGPLGQTAARGSRILS